MLVLAAAEALATGTPMGFPPPSAFPPSMGTTGPTLFAGAGLVCGIPGASALTPAGLPPTVASTVPVAAPATASRLTTMGTRRLGRADGPGTACTARRQRRRTAPASDCIEPNISPQDTVPGAARLGQVPVLGAGSGGVRREPRGRRGSGRAGERLPELLRGCDRGLAGELAADVCGGRSVHQPAPLEQWYTDGPGTGWPGTGWHGAVAEGEHRAGRGRVQRRLVQRAGSLVVGTAHHRDLGRPG